LSFVPNQGQADARVKFTSQGHGYTLFLTPSETVLSLYKPSRPANTLLPGERAKGDVESSGVLRMKLAGANAYVQPTAVNLLPGKSNYYLGNDSQKWLTNVPNYGRVTYGDIYPGVDLVYYGNNQQQLEYDFVVKAGADPRAIRFAFDLAGMSREGKKAALSIDDNGDLAIQGANGALRFHKPLVYQPAYTPDGQGRHNLEGRYVLTSGNEVHFAVAGYDKRFPLIIDPTLSFSSYLGGAGPDSGTGIAIDSNSNVDVTGTTASLNFPQPENVTTHQLHRMDGAPPSGSPVAFVSQISAIGSLVFTTFIGGTGGDGANALALDASNNIFITGTTHSANFPVTSGAFQSHLRGPSDAFLTVLTSAGVVNYCTYGGGSGDEDGLAIYVDGNENIYVAGDTSTSTGNLVGNFGPLGYQTTYGGGASDGWLAVLSAGDGVSLTYLTYFGGTGTDAITAVTADNAGNAYVTGRTSSPSFITTTPTTILSSNGGGSFDAFVAEFSGTTLEFFTFLGGTGDDEATGIALDPLYIANYSDPHAVTGIQRRAKGTHQKDHPDYTPGEGGSTLYSPFYIYVTGSTDNPAGFFQLQTEPTTSVGPGGGKDAFVVKINPYSDTPTIVYSNFFGGSGDDVPSGLMLDLSGNAYVVGTTDSTNFPTDNPVTGSCVGGCASGTSTDAFLVRLNPQGLNLVFSSYLGGSGADSGAAIAQDVNAGTWLTGSTASTDFPTQSPFQAALGNSTGSTNVFVADIAGVAPIRNLPGFTTSVFPANDDDVTDQIPLGTNFNSGNGLNFFGTTYQSLYISNNGILTFGPLGADFGAYTPTGLTESGVPPIIAPFWADVETSGNGSGLVTYGNDTVNGFNAFGVNWINVGYFDDEVDKLNSFQVVLIDRQDVAPGDFDIEFNYAKIQWETGEASGGIDGIGGTPVHIGYSNGSGQAGTNFELPGSGTTGYFLDSNPATGLIYSGNGSVLGRLKFQVRAGQVQQPGSDVNITLTHMPDPVNVGSPLTINMTVTDNGPADATGVSVMDAFPTNATFVSAVPSQGTCGGTTVVTCNLGTITNGHSATIALVVTVTSGTSLSDTATVTSTSTDPNLANNSSTTTANVITGTAPIASLSPVNLTYQHNLNLLCPSKPLILSNTGGSPLLISSIVAGGAFAISANACPTSLAAGANCEIDVSFTAEAPEGMYGGSVTITDNAAGSPQVVPLSGQVFPPCLMQSNTTTQQLLRSTPSATFNITDTHPSCHTTTTTMSCINNQQASCAFNPATISPGGSTVLTVQNLNALTTDNFSFTAQGTDKTNTTGVNLSVLFSDFTYTPAATTATVTAGQTATYALTLTPVNGLSGIVNLACQGAPAGSTCSVSPSSVTLAQNYPAQVSVSVTTAGRSMGAPQGGAPLQGPGASLRLWLELASLLALLALTAWGAVGTRRARAQQANLAYRRLRLSGLVLAALALMLMVWAACGGGGSSVANINTNPATPAGTYALTVTGTFSTSSGQATGLTRTESLTLQVQ
jgi:uncharacterized repeat protein (TIGR01451 family)